MLNQAERYERFLNDIKYMYKISTLFQPILTLVYLSWVAFFVYYCSHLISLIVLKKKKRKHTRACARSREQKTTSKSHFPVNLGENLKKWPVIKTPLWRQMKNYFYVYDINGKRRLIPIL